MRSRPLAKELRRRLRRLARLRRRPPAPVPGVVRSAVVKAQHVCHMPVPERLEQNRMYIQLTATVVQLNRIHRMS